MEMRRKKGGSFSLSGILVGSRLPVVPRRHVDLTDFAAPPITGDFPSIKPGRRKSPELGAAKSAKSSYRLFRNNRRAASRRVSCEKGPLFFLALRGGGGGVIEKLKNLSNILTIFPGKALCAVEARPGKTGGILSRVASTCS